MYPLTTDITDIPYIQSNSSQLFHTSTLMTLHFPYISTMGSLVIHASTMGSFVIHASSMGSMFHTYMVSMFHTSTISLRFLTSTTISLICSASSGCMKSMNSSFVNNLSLFLSAASHRRLSLSIISL